MAMKTLSGKLVAITGAASGMGRSLALECVRRGADVAIVDIDQAGVEETAARAKSSRLGAKVDAARLDCGDRDAIYAWAARVEKSLGGADVIVNNAGVSLSASVEKMTDQDFHWLFDINFWGVVNGTRAFLPQLRKKPDAHVVNLSSVFGLIGVPTQSAYCAAKFAVRGFTESLRQELAGTSIHVSCVHPGGIKTDIVKRGRHYEDALGQDTDTSTAAADFAKAARTTADDAARVILRGVLKNEPRVLIGADAVAIDAMARLAPRGYDAIVGRAVKAGARRRTR
jgi:butyryl-CoA dehydrogenase